MGNGWRDPTAAWSAKTARAQEHLTALDAEIRAFLRGGSYRVEPEPGRPHETVYRLRMSQPVPVRLSTIIGDVLHNLRSALDCVAFELARRHVGRDLEPAEEEATGFPVSDTPQSFEKFFTHPRRLLLYGEREREAMRVVQPAWLPDELVRRGVERARPREEEVEWDSLWLVRRLSNVDKHRRLHVTVMWPDLVYWGSDEPSRRRWRYGAPPFDDGAVLGYLIDDPEHPELPATVHHELELRIVDRIAGHHDVAGLLGSLHRDVDLAISSVFASWENGASRAP